MIYVILRYRTDIWSDLGRSTSTQSSRGHDASIYGRKLASSVDTMNNAFSSAIGNTFTFMVELAVQWGYLCHLHIVQTPHGERKSTIMHLWVFLLLYPSVVFFFPSFFIYILCHLVKITFFCSHNVTLVYILTVTYESSELFFFMEWYL